MTRKRVLLTIGLLLTFLPGLGASSHAVRAASGKGVAQTDFTRIAPADATLFATIQSTSTDQAINLSALTSAITSQPGFQSIMQSARTSGKNGSVNGMATMIFTQVAASLGTMFNGELGLVARPVTTQTLANGKVVPRLHLLLGAGLQSGVSAAQVNGLLLLLGVSASSTTTYSGVSIGSIDLNTALGMLKSMSNHRALTAGGMAPSMLYTAVIGNIAVLATDLTTMKAAIDTSSGAQPTIASNTDFQTTTGALPSARAATLYFHYDLAATVQILRSLRGGQISSRLASRTGALSQALAISARTDGLLFTASPSVRTGSLIKQVALSPLQNTSAAQLPAGTLFYASLNDPGALIQSLITQGMQFAQEANLPIKPLDPVKILNRLLGLNVDQDLLSWMHGEASVALLPVGNNAQGGSFPGAQRLSLVMTLKVSDQALVDQKLQQLDAAFQGLSTDPNGLQLVETTGTGGSPERILAATPNGIGYTFNNGYLILATALPTDLTALQGATSSTNLSTDPRYQAALSAVGSGSHGIVSYWNLTAARQTFESIAQASGKNLNGYNQHIRPLLTAFKSVAMVTDPGANGGGALFLGIAQ